jgi:hypothetical protein
MNCRVLKGATAFAWYDKGLLAVSRPAEFRELKMLAWLFSQTPHGDFIGQAEFAASGR